MPLYQFLCPAGHEFEERAGYDVEVRPCACGEAAHRAAFYRSSGVIFSGNGFTKGTIPAASDGAMVQHEMGKELKARGWGEGRVLEEMRKARRFDSEGRMSIDMAALPKEA